MPTTVQTHLDALNRLIHDSGNTLASQADKIAWISEAVRRRDLDTGSNRSILTAALIAGQDTYTFTALGNPRIFDVVSVFLVYGNKRVQMARLPYSMLTRNFRLWTNYTSYPIAFSVIDGQDNVILGPVPGSAYSTEWDVCVYTSVLSAVTDNDPLTYPYSDAVPYYAAHLYKANEQQWEEAEFFQGQYEDKVKTALSSRAGMVSAPYGARR